jgi:hypothetical protein
MTRSQRLHMAADACTQAFGIPSPEPFGVDDERLAGELEKAVLRGQPIGPKFDWWTSLPPGADA